MKSLLSIYVGLCFISCQPMNQAPDATPNYSSDSQFLRKHTEGIIELQDAEGKAKVLLSTEYQGRVMTSTSGGEYETSYGWLNYDLLSSGQKKKQFNPIGGEERLWLGPEGGQYSFYFPHGSSFEIANWQVPALIDTVSYDVVESSPTHALFTKKATIVNYAGTVFDMLIERKITLLTKNEIEQTLKTELSSSLSFVAYQTQNQLENIGKVNWTKENGLPSIWLLGMFTPSESTIIIIPFKAEPHAANQINTNYFGEMPSDRLTIKDSVLFFTCDGKYRSKIGLPPSIAKPIAASFDFQKNILTLVTFELDNQSEYVNSKWEIQKEPYNGDAVNAYNDGRLADGTQLGPFYEIESSSPALALAVGERGSYKQTTFHAEGDFEALNKLSKKILGVDLTEIRK